MWAIVLCNELFGISKGIVRTSTTSTINVSDYCQFFDEREQACREDETYLFEVWLFFTVVFDHTLYCLTKKIQKCIGVTNTPRKEELRGRFDDDEGVKSFFVIDYKHWEINKITLFWFSNWNKKIIWTYFLL